MNPQKQGKSAELNVFAEIKKNDGSTLEGFIYCRKCKHLLNFNGKQTSILMRHKCFVNVSEQQVVLKNVSQEDKKCAISVCSKWIIEDYRPFIIVEGSGFEKLADFFY